MSVLGNAFATELLKSRRSRVPWGVAAAFTMVPLVSGLFMVILEDPERARELGLLGTKAQLTAGTADWPTFLDLLGQAVAIAGTMVFAFLTAWVFGREFADRTVRNLLAIPTPRWAVVVAKALVVGLWDVAICAWIVALGLAIGAGLGLPGWSADRAASTLQGIAVAALMTICLQTVTAFFAGVGRGYIAPLAWIVAAIVASQILAALGRGNLFPWAVPALVVGAGGPAVEPANALSFAIVAVTAAAGLAGTIAWWSRADQSG